MKKLLFTIASLSLLIPQLSFASTLFTEFNLVNLDESLVPRCAQGVDTLIFLANKTGANAGDDSGFVTACSSFNDQALEDAALPNGNAQDTYTTASTVGSWLSGLPMHFIVLEIDGDYSGSPGSDNYETIVADVGFVGEDTLDLVQDNFSGSNWNTLLASSIETVSGITATTMTIILGLVGLLIAAGWAWRFLKRHIGKRI